MMESHDGADTWSEIPGLTSLITDGGRFQFNSDAFAFASHVSFSTDDPNSVAIGTQQNGLFVSRDRGAHWTKVPKSERATGITSVEWMSATDAFVSTLGRGLWKLTGSPVVNSVASLCAVQSCLLKYVFTGDPAPDQFQRGIVVFEGEIMGARIRRRSASWTVGYAANVRWLCRGSGALAPCSTNSPYDTQTSVPGASGSQPTKRLLRPPAG